jgi:selT/selW/selH-like putative selenoprotein
MRIEIKYCGQWNYEPRARAAASLIRKIRPDAQVTLRRSGGGVFEIIVDDHIACSKQTVGRFPTDAEIIAVVTWFA